MTGVQTCALPISRREAGRILARKHPCDCDIVIGVPESGIDAVRFRTPEDFDTEELEAGWRYVRLNENEFPLFVRRGTFVILAKSRERTSDLSPEGAVPLGWDAEDYVLPLYRDDRITFGAPDGHVVPVRMGRNGAESFVTNF